MPRKIYLLSDYRSNFYSSVKLLGEGFRIELVRKYFAESGIELEVLRFPEINFRKDNFKDRYVLYHSSEDPGLFYKSYLEDVLLGLHLQGAHLIPDFFKFRAHHNKVFMETLRDLNGFDGMKQIVSKGYGTYEDFKRDIGLYPGPIVMKPACGAMSTGVKLVTTDSEKIRHSAKISRTFKLLRVFKNLINRIRRKNYRTKSNNRKKFIVQNFIPDLEGDFKILIYFDKYYVLHRKIRKNDFRASGSGLFSYSRTLPAGLLDYAETVFKTFDVPYLSIDVACSGGEYFLLEFQFLSFGNYTIENSKHYFTRCDNGWDIVEEEPLLEREFVNSVVAYITKIENNSQN